MQQCYRVLLVSTHQRFIGTTLCASWQYELNGTLFYRHNNVVTRTFPGIYQFADIEYVHPPLQWLCTFCKSCNIFIYILYTCIQRGGPRCLYLWYSHNGIHVFELHINSGSRDEFIVEFDNVNQCIETTFVEERCICKVCNWYGICFIYIYIYVYNTYYYWLYK